MSHDYSFVKDQTYFYVLLRLMQDDITYLRKNKHIPQHALKRMDEQRSTLLDQVYDENHHSYIYVILNDKK